MCVGVTADDMFVTVTIEEKQPLVGTSRLMMMLGAKDNQLKQWTDHRSAGLRHHDRDLQSRCSEKDPIRACSRSTMRSISIATCSDFSRPATDKCRPPPLAAFMRLTVTTWNINSVRLRIDLGREIRQGGTRLTCSACRKPSVRTTRFPLKRFKRLGYEHVALNGQKGYHGVAVVSRLSVRVASDIRVFCGKTRLTAHLGGVGRPRPG